MERKYGRKNPKHKPRWRQADLAFSDQDLWDKIATEGGPPGEDEICVEECKHFQPASGPKVQSGQESFNNGKCRAAQNQKVAWGTSICLAPELKEIKHQSP